MAARKALTVVQSARRQGQRGWWFLLALGAIGMVGGGTPLMSQTANGDVSRNTGNVPVERVARTKPAELAPKPADATPVGRAAALEPPPVRLAFPRLAIDAPVLPVSVGVDGLLGVPDHPRQLGWWIRSGRPGMPSGSVVIDGHVDSAALGPGAFFRLRQARPGDAVTLTNATGRSTTYTVVARRTYPKASLPAAEVFATDVGPRLVLLTCGGWFDRETRHYDDNIVVYAVPR